MEDLFQHGAYVRLRARLDLTEESDEYLCAHEDGRTVSLRSCGLPPPPPTMSTVWRVHRATPPTGRTSLRIHLLGAAYGRYFGLQPPIHALAVRPIQSSLESEDQRGFSWVPIPVEDAEQGVVRLRCVRVGMLHHESQLCDECSWKVEHVPTTSTPPPLPLPPPFPEALQRTIWYLRPDDHGNFNRSGWATFQFHGRSVWLLKTEVVRRLGNASYFFRVLMCTRAGRYGRLTPLLVDLPRDEETVDVIVLITGTPAADALRFPNLGAA